jgi:hypothetical protein
MILPDACHSSISASPSGRKKKGGGEFKVKLLPLFLTVTILHAEKKIPLTNQTSFSGGSILSTKK